MSLGSIVVRLTMNTADFDTDSKRAAKIADKRAKEIDASFRKAGAAIGAAIAAGIGVAVYAIGQSIDRMDELSKTAQKVGMPTEEISALGYAAELADVELSALQGGLSKLTKFQAAAAEGTEANVQLFRALGIEFQNIDSTLRSTGDVFRDFAGVFGSIPDGAEKSALALQVFGRAGADLIPLLNGGADGLDEMTRRAAELGLVVSTEAGKAAEEFNDRLSDLRLMVGGLAGAVAVELLPDLNRLVKEFQEGTETGEGFATTAKDIADYLRAIGTVANFVIKGVQGIALGIAGIATGTGAAIAQLLGMQDRASLGSQLSAEAFDMAGGKFSDAVGGGGDSGDFDWAAEEKKAAAYAEAAKAALAEEAAGEARLAAIKEEQRKQAEAAAAARAAESAAATAARQAEAEAARAQADAERELERIREEGKDAAAQLKDTIADNAADLGGPAAQALRDYTVELTRLIGEEEKLRAAKLLTAETEAQLAVAREQADAKYQAQLADIEKERTATFDGLIADLEFERKLIGLSNLEREKEIALRYLGADATDAQREAVAALIEENERARDVAEGMDVLRDATRGLFEDLMDGSKSAKEAFSDFVDNILDGIAQIVAKNLTENLLGSFGSTGGGQSGDWLSGLFGSLFGGARAGGGDVYPGKAYTVGENGRETFIPATAGTIVPAGETTRMGRGGVVNNTFLMPGRYDLRTQAQVSADAGRGSQRALARGTA